MNAYLIASVQTLTGTPADVDYIVMGTRGMSPLRKLVVGSVSEYVVKAAVCPVMLVRDPKKR